MSIYIIRSRVRFKGISLMTGLAATFLFMVVFLVPDFSGISI